MMICYYGERRVYDLYWNQPLGGDQDALSSLLESCHVIYNLKN